MMLKRYVKILVVGLLIPTLFSSTAFALNKTDKVDPNQESLTLEKDKQAIFENKNDVTEIKTLNESAIAANDSPEKTSPAEQKISHQSKKAVLKTNKLSTKATNGLSGTIGTSDWFINDSGELHIGAGDLGNSPTNGGAIVIWTPTDKAKVTSIIFDGAVKVSGSIANLFSLFTNVQRIDNANLLDVSNVTVMSGLFLRDAKLTSIDVSSWKTSKVLSMNSLFEKCSSLVGLDVSNWDTRQVATLGNVFNGAAAIKTLDLSKWDVSKVTNLDGTFYNMGALTDLNVSNWNTSQVTSMKQTFGTDYFSAYTSHLAQLDVSQWDTSQVKDMTEMFSGTKVKTLDLASWNTQAVTSMDSMFYRSKVTSLDLSKWNMSKVTNTNLMFGYTTVLKAVGDISQWDFASMLRTSGMFRSSVVTSLDVAKWNMSHVTNMSDMFGYVKVPVLDVSSWDVSNVLDMSFVFESATIPNLDVSKWNVAKVTSLAGTFLSYQSTTPIDVSKWETGNVRTLASTFFGIKLATVDVSNWDVSNVTSLNGTFQSAANLNKVDVSKWNTQNVTNMHATFGSSPKLKEINVSNWLTGKVTDFGLMFQQSQADTLDVSKWDTSAAQNMQSFFEGTSVSQLDTSHFKTDNVLYMEKMFTGMSNLTSLDISSFNMGKIKTQKTGNSTTYGLTNMLHTNTSSGATLEHLKLGPQTLLTEAATGEIVGLDNPTQTDVYTGKWQRDGTSETYLAADLMSKYDGSTMAGSYSWAKIQKGTVVVKYLDQDDQPIAAEDTMSDDQGKTYTTTAKTIPGYAPTSTPANATGTYVGNQTIEVVYHYAGALSLMSTPRTMSFGSHLISLGEEKYQLETLSNDLVVQDNRKVGSTWQLSARMSADFVSQTSKKKLKSTLAYRDVDGHTTDINATGGTVIKSQKTINHDPITVSKDWTSLGGDGFVLDVLPGPTLSEAYSAKVEWTLTDADMGN